MLSIIQYIETFIYDVTLYKVMKATDPSIRRILGKVEIETIMKRMKGRKLKQTERNYLSRSIRPKLIAAKLLTESKILEKIQKPDRSLEKIIIYNLSAYGYDLIALRKIPKQKKISIENLIGIIIAKNPKPRFIEAIPILLLKNKIDKFKLVETAYEYDINNELGYIIETAVILSEEFRIKQDLKDLLDYLKRNKKKNIKYLGEEKDSEYRQFLKKTSPKRVKKWNLLGRFFDDDFIEGAEALL